MSLLEAIVMAIVQGTTEFLPISSSAHLIMVPWWLGWEPPGILYDVVVHLGTTLALIIYFWSDWLMLLRAGFDILRKRSMTEPNERLFVLIILATIPAALAGVLLESFFEKLFEDVALAAATLLLTAALLFYCERAKTSNPRPMESLNTVDALIIGIAQAISILPGISRSGATIASGLLRGLTREAATRFSFLMATPIILAAGLKQALDVALGDEVITSDMTAPLIAGFLVSLIVGYFSIGFLLSFVRTRSLNVFAIYCTVFSVVTLLALALQG
jgi:undecaprenyl-diphosphatase